MDPACLEVSKVLVRVMVESGWQVERYLQTLKALLRK